ncbi:MAG: helicase [Aquificaceae bacterium]|nr:helicase [Aquificaceae bacterium]
MELTQALGFVFEGAFKLGFMKDKLEDAQYRSFVEGIFAKLEENYREEKLKEHIEKVKSFFESIKLKMPYSLSGEFPPELRVSGFDTTPEGAVENYTKVAFFLGYSAGLLYGAQHEDVVLKKFSMSEEHSEVVWKNADLMFLEKEVLYVVDFKASGLTNKIKDIAISKNVPQEKVRSIYIPFVNYGVPINLSLGQLSLEKFLEKLMKTKEEMLRLKNVFVEIKGFLQVLSYAVDYLVEEKDPVREVVLELVYPLQESLRVRFNLENREALKGYQEGIKELYKSLKSRSWSYKAADEPSPVRSPRLKEEYTKEKERLLRTIEEIQKEKKKLDVDHIDGAREDVRKRVEDFVKGSQTCKALALLQSAGSGKTSNVRNAILNMPGRHIVLYFATRKRIVEKEYEAVKKKIESRNGIALLGRPEKRSSHSLLHKGDYFEPNSTRKGILQKMVEGIKKASEKHEQIWGFATLQSIVETGVGSTTRHMKEFLTPRIYDNYTLHFILDEFLGFSNGIFAISELFELARKFRDRGGRVNLYLFDANGYTPELLKGILQEYEKYEVVPEAVVLCNFLPELEVSYGDVPLFIYAKHGFPSKELWVYRKFLRVKDFEKKEDYLKLVEYIKETFTNRDESTAFVFLQDKDAIAHLSHLLKEQGISTLVATASSRKSQEDISKGKEDIILGTSSVSRGLDFSREHKPLDHIYIVVSDWGLENNLVEVIQAISRARGDEKTEKRPKHLHIVYLLFEEVPEYVIDNILSLHEHADREVIRLIYEVEYLKQKIDLDRVVVRIVEQFLKSKEGRVLVPVPAQHKTVYAQNKVSQLEAVVTFLEDIQLMEKDGVIKEKLRRLRDVLLSAVDIYTEDIPKNLSRVTYYHPYILLERAKLHLTFDNEKRKEASILYRELKEVLKGHNEELSEEVGHFINSVAPSEGYEVPILLPVYSLVFTKQVLYKEDPLIRFKVGGRVGRGGARVMGGKLEFWTRCLNDEVSKKEYACIPLGEDYPYREVLSGRFARFPVEFLRELLEVEDGDKG